MKELSTEQKAKRYNEVLEKAMKELQTCGSTDCEAARQIFRFFPELKESEDERIVKCLLNYFNHVRYNELDLKGTDVDEVIAWLEEQGKKDKLIQELGEYKVKYIQETLGKALTMNNKDDERLRKTTIAFLKEFADKGYENAVECIDWLEKHGEKPQGKSALEAIKEEKVDNQNCVKPADKVEPKFKIGDWIIYNRNDHSREVIQIYDIRDNRYYFNDNIHFSWSVKECDEKSHLWTIQDAKDGDVLVCPKYAGDIIPNIFIFKDIKIKDNDVFCYCSFIEAFRTESYIANADPINTDFYPATKEQRDTLMKAMADAGYTFDFEKKELKKIEQKHYEWSEED